MELINSWMVRNFMALIFIVITLPACHAQRADSLRANPTRLKVVIIGSGVAYTGAMVGLNSIWYSQYDRQSFRFFNDAREWKQMDKIGHFYSGFQLSSIDSRLFQWSGVSKKKSDKIGAITSFAIMSSIEILDGFSAGYGASASDWIANAAGSGFYLGQNLLWNEVRLYPKYSFHRTSIARERPNTLGSNLAEELIKDYNGQTQWISVDMDKFMRFPKWLNISVGYGVNEMRYANDAENESQGFRPYRQIYLGLDFDLTAIKSRSKVINSLIYFANMVRIPAPALELSQKKLKGHWLYF